MKKNIALTLIFLLCMTTTFFIDGCGQSQNPPPPPANIIRLFYIYPTNPDPAKKDYTNQNIGSAYSSDGVSFTPDSGVRLNGAYLTDPDAFKESSSKWTIFYSKATSSDQTLYKATCATSSGSYTTDTTFKGLYGNISSTISIGGTFYVYGVSAEGIVVSSYDPAADKLTKIKVAVAPGSLDPSVIKLSTGTYKMYYKSSGDVYSADSADGLTWTNNTKLISYGEVPGAVVVSNKIYLYYIVSRPSDPNMGKIVVITSSDNGASFSSPQVTSGLQEGSCDPDPVVYE